MGEKIRDYYLVFCKTDHGKRYWRITGDWSTVANKVLIEEVGGRDIEEAEECARQNFDLDEWIEKGTINGE